ncbi:metallophosphoesterase [Paenirhodobacter sp. CAU 1674]|uniref:metallophosphoesterase n=1 Tax=Paenirhodobacter sp. CAU 1674 TaxID=3032596 RepID=UPI0023DC44A3|nr:metallophosphoesterase [Paenirhodobacter sp. CAU 1674]MDF2143184.1 metallophosphoesterase [Paenirhodobacter sp. CAU 1674]
MMFRILPRKSNGPSRRAAEPTRRFDVPLAPARDLAVIGDVHGCDGLLQTLLARLEVQAPGAQLVFVGDLIDRGEASSRVLDTVHAQRDQCITLRGNHEELMLDFLDAPERAGARWLRNGGLQTLASFDIGGVTEHANEASMRRARDQLRDRLGPEKEAWLRSCPRAWGSGNVTVTHAGADPWVPITAQKGRCLTWGHPDFGLRARTDGVWIVHGHTIVPEPVCDQGVISVDTGAFATGRLTAALISSQGVCFVTVSG